MERRRFKQSVSLNQRLMAHAERLLNEAEAAPPGAERDRLVKLARQAQTGAHVSEWLSSPGLQPPR